MKGRIFTPVLSFIGISILFHGCHSSVDSTTESSKKEVVLCKTNAKKTDIKSLKNEPNEEIIKQLDLPRTITYIGIKEPENKAKYKSNQVIPLGMVLVPGGKVKIGDNNGFANESPQFWAVVEPFLMDISPVTVKQFRKFINATRYKTEADKFGNAGVINEETGKEWILVNGANWEYPLGKHRPKAQDNHPVTQVSWNDANAYAEWAGKRLPCEIEFEHAARNATNSRSIYPWGDNIKMTGKWNANVWQGKFPIKNFNEDFYPYTSPVGQFGKTSLGLTDMSGNIWEWTSNKKFDYASLFTRNLSPFSLSNEYAQRGGSFLCEPDWCHGYRVSGRSSSTSETSLFHLGFRCVKDI